MTVKNSFYFEILGFYRRILRCEDSGREEFLRMTEDLKNYLKDSSGPRNTLGSREKYLLTVLERNLWDSPSFSAISWIMEDYLVENFIPSDGTAVVKVVEHVKSRLESFRRSYENIRLTNFDKYYLVGCVTYIGVYFRSLDPISLSRKELEIGFRNSVSDLKNFDHLFEAEDIQIINKLIPLYIEECENRLHDLESRVIEDSLKDATAFGSVKSEEDDPEYWKKKYLNLKNEVIGFLESVKGRDN